MIYPKTLSAFLLFLLCFAAGCDTNDSDDQPIVSNINLSPSGTSMISKGQHFQLTARVILNNGKEQSNAVITWASSDEAILTVSATGDVLGISAGKVKVTASSGDKQGSLFINVIDLTGTWKTSVNLPPVTNVTYIITQEAIHINGTFTASPGLFPTGAEIRGKQGTFGGTLVGNQFKSTLVVTDTGCKETITGTYRLVLNSSGIVTSLVGEGEGAISSEPFCGIFGRTILPTLTRQ